MQSITSTSIGSFNEYLPYIASVLCALISGIVTYFVARKQARTDIQKLEKQFAFDLEKERERFAMEKEKMEIEHRHQLDLLQKEAENNLGNTIISEAMKLPEVRQQVSQGMRNGNRKNKR